MNLFSATLRSTRQQPTVSPVCPGVVQLSLIGAMATTLFAMQQYQVNQPITAAIAFSSSLMLLGYAGFKQYHWQRHGQQNDQHPPLLPNAVTRL